MSKKIILFSRFPKGLDGGGGCKREAQIREILKPLDIHILSFEDSLWSNYPLTGYRYHQLKIEKKLNPYKKYWDPFFHEYVFRLKSATREWIKFLKNNPQVKLVIIDDPIFFYPLVNYLHRKKIPIVALCQNIESLSYGQINSEFQLQIFNKEIKLLNKCRLVVTISKEEAFLLTNYNIPNFFLPYYPTRSLEKRILQVRKKRELSKKNDFLVLGNVWNKVTLQGMEKLFKFWQNFDDFNLKDQLLIAGYGTSRLIKGVEGDRIKLLGEISNQELDDILVRIKAMICYQEHGSGALTKIQDTLLAGVAVYANPHAARSYHSTKGLVQFKEFPQLTDALKRIKGRMIDIPPRPIKPDNQELLNHIQNILQER